MSKDSKARKQKGKILSFIPTGEYYFTKGLKAFHRRDFIKSKKYLQRALQLEPGEPMIACQLAIVWTELGDYEQSNKLLHLILEELDDEMAECHYFLANNYAHMGFFKDAYNHAKLYLELEPEGDFMEDTEDLIELLTLEEDDMDDELYEEDDLIAKQEQARDLLESGYFPKAIELLNSVVEEYPEYWSAYNNLALAYFYLGEAEKAESILMDVLTRNPGNLHALCNLLVFAHYLKQPEKVSHLIGVLKKVTPLLTEHQFKLGATFALVGEYESAYVWLRKLYKSGFNGDGPYYYWLSYAAYHTGHEKMARTMWELVLQVSPEKEGLEPWNETREPINGFEDHVESIYQKLDSDYLEERLFALFLISVSEKRDSLLSAKRVTQNDKLSLLEQEYLQMIKTGKRKRYSPAADADEVAKILYEFHQPIGTMEAGLYLMWFSVFAEALKTGAEIQNKIAWAAAMDFIWSKLRGVKLSQKVIAGQYGISASTIGKYIKLVNSCLQ